MVIVAWGRVTWLGSVGPGAELVIAGLSARELQALAEAFPDAASARNLLDLAKFPRSHYPWDSSNAMSFWAAVSGSLLAGVMRDGRVQLLEAARSMYPENLVFGTATNSDRRGVPASRIRVFLLDDHEIACHGAYAILSKEPDMEVVGVAHRADEAFREIMAVQPDVAVLDERLEDGSGIEVCRQVRSANPKIACLILTSFEDESARFSATMSGVADYVLKSIRGESLVESLRQVARASPKPILHRMPDYHKLERLTDLTDRERRILRFVADGLTNRQIASQLLLAEPTVKKYVSGILAKLNLESRTQAAIFVTSLLHSG